MYQLVLLRHGESIWNKENRFTGWTDVDLSDKGIEEAHRGGKLLQKKATPLIWLILRFSNGPSVPSGLCWMKWT